MNKFQSIYNPTYMNVEGLTLLYGPNSAGKSSIIDVLRLLKNIVGGFAQGGRMSDIDAFSVSGTRQFILSRHEDQHVSRVDLDAVPSASHPDRFSAAFLRSFAKNLDGTWISAGYFVEQLTP